MSAFEDICIKLNKIERDLEKAARLKRQYEFTIGVLAALVAILAIRVFA